MRNYYISIVVATRNDNHGENMRKKNQYFLDKAIDQIEKYKINAEIIVVEWNPPEKNLPLRKVIKIKKKYRKNVRFITVNRSIHKKFKYSDKIQFYQMIAKNVGVLRSNAKFILTTNIDIILSNELMNFIAQKKLEKKTLYRLDRYDIDFNNFKEINLKDDHYLKRVTLVNKKNYAYDVRKKIRYHVNFNFLYLIDFIFFRIKHSLFKKKLNFSEIIKNFFIKLPQLFSYKLHTNACGDFLLMDKKTWHKLRGFDEFEGYSWHLDSLFMWKAFYNKITIKNLKYKIFHMNHKIGSGYSPGSNKLFNKLIKKNIKFINDNEFHRIVKNKSNFTRFKNANWGLKKEKLREF